MDRYVPTVNTTPGADAFFEVNRLVHSITFALVRPDHDCTGQNCLAVVSPGGQTVGRGSAGAEYYEGLQFAILTIDRPEAGRWRVPAATINGGVLHIIVRSSLRLRLTGPASVRPLGAPVELEVLLGQVKDSNNVLEVFGANDTVEAAITRPDGTPEATPLRLNYAGVTGGDGNGARFSGTYAASVPGVYRVRLSYREQEYNIVIAGQGEFTVKEFPTLALVEPAPGRPTPVRMAQPVVVRARLLPPNGESEVGSGTRITAALLTLRRTDGSSLAPITMQPDVTGVEATAQIPQDVLTEPLQMTVSADVLYLGSIAYSTASANAAYQPELVPQVAVTADQPINFGHAFRVEGLPARQFEAQAWSKQAIEWSHPLVSGVDGLDVALSPRRLLPNGRATVELRLSYNGPELAPNRVYSGTITLKAGEVPIEPAELSFRFTLGQAVLSVTPPAAAASPAEAFTVAALPPTTLTVLAEGDSPAQLSGQLTGVPGVRLARLAPETIEPNRPTAVAFYLETTGDELSPGPYTGKLVLGAAGYVAATPETPFEFKIKQPTVQSSLAWPSLGRYWGPDDLEAIPFQVDADLPARRSLEVSVLDASGQPSKDIEARLDPPDLLPAQGGANYKLLMRVKGRSGPFGRWSCQGCTIALSAGPGVAVEPQSVKFSLERPFWLDSVGQTLGQFVTQLFLPLLLILAAFVALWLLSFLAWWGWRLRDSREVTVTLVPVQLNGSSVEPDVSRSSYTIPIHGARGRAFGLAIGRKGDRVPVVYGGPWRARLWRGWVRLCRVETPNQNPPEPAPPPPPSGPKAPYAPWAKLAAVAPPPVEASRLVLRVRGLAGGQVAFALLGGGAAQWAEAPTPPPTLAPARQPTPKSGWQMGPLFANAVNVNWTYLNPETWQPLTPQMLLKLDGCDFQIETNA
jgi:hypothetical protein